MAFPLTKEKGRKAPQRYRPVPTRRKPRHKGSFVPESRKEY